MFSLRACAKFLNRHKTASKFISHFMQMLCARHETSRALLVRAARLHCITFLHAHTHTSCAMPGPVLKEHMRCE